MKKLIYFIALCLFTTISFNGSAQLSVPFTLRLNVVLDSVCKRYAIHGASVAVLVPNVGTWKGVYGISEMDVPVEHDMLFGMGSNTKTYMAAMLLKMQEQGLLSLDDSIGKWITGYPNINGKITIRQCLNHTSGLFDYMQNTLVNDTILSKPDKIWKPEEILHLAKAPNFAPGNNWDYSNTNYTIAGIIIEKVLNKPAYQAINQFILTPNGLTKTIDFNENTQLPFAHPWSMVENGTSLYDMTITNYLQHLFSLAGTAGSLITTSEDNVNFWHKLFSGQIINQQSWKEMTTMVNLGNNTQYGLGIFRYNRKINGRTAYSHGGTFFGYINENIVDTTSGIVISVLTNQDSIDNNLLLSRVIGALHKVTIQMPTTGITESHWMQNTITVYPNPANQYVTIKQQGEKIWQADLFDLAGNLVKTETVLHDKMDTNNLPNGIYTMHLKNQQGKLLGVKKLAVVH